MKLDYEYINELKRVIDSNKDKRICVVGTSCTGKTTYLEHAKNGLDMDKIIFPLMTDEEKEYVCQTPWTPEIPENFQNNFQKTFSEKNEGIFEHFLRFKKIYE